MKAKNVDVVNNMGKKIAWIIIGILSVLVIGAMFMFGLKKEKLTIRSLHFTYTSGYAMYAYTTYDIYLEDNKYYVTIKPYGVSEEESQTVKLDTKTINKLIIYFILFIIFVHLYFIYFLFSSVIDVIGSRYGLTSET